MLVRHRELVLKRVVREVVHGLTGRLGLRPALPSVVEDMELTERMDFFREQHVREYEEYVLQRNDIVRELA